MLLVIEMSPKILFYNTVWSFTLSLGLKMRCYSWSLLNWKRIYLVYSKTNVEK